MNRFQITEYCHYITESFAQNPELCIDATMGNGSDTLFLCKLAGNTGKVLAFDIQERAIENTKKLLEENSCLSMARLILDSHENMDRYAENDSADIIMFNFGYLPGGDHSLATKAESSLKAIEKSLNIIKKGGIISLCIYSGGDSGYEEKAEILKYLRRLDPKKYLVITHEYYNRPKNPPLPVLIKRL